MKPILERISARSKAFKVTSCFCLLGLVGAIDYATGVEISVSAFYPLPVVLMAWFAGRRAAVGMAGLAALTQLVTLLARKDPLTEAANRRAFFERMEQESLRARRHGSTPLSLAYLELDDFKSVNDRFGHEAGDDILRTVATTIQDRIRSTDLLARLGGDDHGRGRPPDVRGEREREERLGDTVK